MNFNGFSGSTVANILGLEIFFFTLASVFVGISSISIKYNTCMALVACLLCCISLPLTGLTGIMGIEIQREEAIYYIAAGVIMTGLA